MKHAPTLILVSLLFALTASGEQPKPAAVLRGCGGVAVSFSKDGSKIFTAGKDAARVWDGRTFEPLTAPMTPAGGVRAAGLSADGKKVMTAGADHFARIWDAQSGKQLLAIDCGGPIWSAALSPDGSTVAIGEVNDVLTLWDARTGAKRFQVRAPYHPLTARDSPRLPSEIAFVQFSSDGAKVLAAPRSKGIFVWDARTGKQLADREGDRAPAELDEGERSVRPAGFSADGSAVASTSEGFVLVWDAGNGQLLCPLIEPPASRSERSSAEWPTVAAVSPDGKQVAAAGYYAWVWRVSDEKVDLVAGTPPVRSARDLVFSPDGKRLLIAARFNDAGIYDAQSGDQVFTIGRDSDEIPNVAYSPDGKFVAATFPRDDFTTIWPTPAGRWR